MSPLKEFFKTTITGGVMFLVPVIVLGLVLRHAMNFAGRITRPIAERFPAHAIAGVAAFLPQSPTPLSGNVMYLPADRVRPLDIGFPKAMKLVKQMGMGSADSLKGIDLTPPPGS